MCIRDRWYNASYDDVTFIVVVDEYGNRAALYSIKEEAMGVSTHKIFVESVDFLFLGWGVVHRPSSSIGHVLCTTAYNGLVFGELKVGFDDEPPQMVINESGINHIDVLDKYITGGDDVIFSINATDDEKIDTLEWNITYFGQSGVAVYSEWGVIEGPSGEVDLEIVPNISEDVFNMTVKIVAYDVVHKNTTYECCVYIDRYSPRISVMAPEEISISGDYICLYAYVWDDLWVSKVYVDVEGQKIPMIPKSHSMHPGATIVYYAEISSDLLKSEKNVVYVYAKDFASKTVCVGINVTNPWYKKSEFRLPGYVWLLIGIGLGAMMVISIPYVKRMISHVRSRSKGESMVDSTEA